MKKYIISLSLLLACSLATAMNTEKKQQLINKNKKIKDTIDASQYKEMPKPVFKAKLKRDLGPVNK